MGGEDSPLDSLPSALDSPSAFGPPAPAPAPPPACVTVGAVEGALLVLVHEFEFESSVVVTLPFGSFSLCGVVIGLASLGVPAVLDVGAVLPS